MTLYKLLTLLICIASINAPVYGMDNNNHSNDQQIVISASMKVAALLTAAAPLFIIPGAGATALNLIPEESSTIAIRSIASYLADKPWKFILRSLVLDPYLPTIPAKIAEQAAMYPISNTLTSSMTRMGIIPDAPSAPNPIGVLQQLAFGASVSMAFDRILTCATTSYIDKFRDHLGRNYLKKSHCLKPLGCQPALTESAQKKLSQYVAHDRNQSNRCYVSYDNETSRWIYGFESSQQSSTTAPTFTCFLYQAKHQIIVKEILSYNDSPITTKITPYETSETEWAYLIPFGSKRFGVLMEALRKSAIEKHTTILETSLTQLTFNEIEVKKNN